MALESQWMFYIQVQPYSENFQSSSHFLIVLHLDILSHSSRSVMYHFMIHKLEMDAPDLYQEHDEVKKLQIH